MNWFRLYEMVWKFHSASEAPLAVPLTGSVWVGVNKSLFSCGTQIKMCFPFLRRYFGCFCFSWHCLVMTFKDSLFYCFCLLCIDSVVCAFLFLNAFHCCFIVSCLVCALWKKAEYTFYSKIIGIACK